MSSLQLVQVGCTKNENVALASPFKTYENTYYGWPSAVYFDRKEEATVEF